MALCAITEELTILYAVSTYYKYVILWYHHLNVSERIAALIEYPTFVYVHLNESTKKYIYECNAILHCG